MKRGEPIEYEEETTLKQEEVKLSEKKGKKYVSRFGNVLFGDNSKMIKSKQRRQFYSPP